MGTISQRTTRRELQLSRDRTIIFILQICLRSGNGNVPETLLASLISSALQPYILLIFPSCTCKYLTSGVPRRRKMKIWFPLYRKQLSTLWKNSNKFLQTSRISLRILNFRDYVARDVPGQLRDFCIINAGDTSPVTYVNTVRDTRVILKFNRPDAVIWCLRPCGFHTPRPPFLSKTHSVDYQHRATSRY